MKTHEGKSVTRVVTLILLLLWMAVIFWFSAQDATESGGLSSSLSEKLACLQNRVLHLGWTKQKIMEISIWLEKPLRKCAHASEYALLGILCMAHLNTYRISSTPETAKGFHWRTSLPLRILLAEILCVLYAATDEFHQLFVEGRSGQVTDVCIDGGGALLGILIMTGVSVLEERRRQNKNFHDN